MGIRDIYVLLFVVGLLAEVTQADHCPHEDDTLSSFSSLFSDYDKSSDLEITEATLLDVGSLDINTITISGSGKLVFNQGLDITINTKGIRVVDNGALIIGSEECRHEDKVNIILEGTRTEQRDQVGEDGEKFITVTDNGVLQIHGEDKISWTKLTSTVNRFQSEPSKIKYLHSATPPSRYNPLSWALSMYVLHPNLTVASYNSHSLYHPKSHGRSHQQRDLIVNKVKDAEEGSVIAISIQNKLILTPGVNFTTIFDTLEEAAGMAEGELLLRKAGVDAYSLVFSKGGDYEQTLASLAGFPKQTASATIVQSGHKVTAVSTVGIDRRQSSIDLRVIEEDIGFPVITVVDDVSSWQIGDEVLLTSTDYSWKHGEVRTIKEKIDEHTLMLSDELEYRHFGEIVQGVDMRGEVALLTRNIHIRGSMQPGCPAENGNCKDKWILHDTFGGHIKIYNSFGSVYIAGAMLTNMGQTPDTGHYPVHFHMCKDISGKTAIVKRNAIRHTYARATTIHGTWGTSLTKPGVQILENVAYDISGHAYFTEDGAEAATLFIGNLGAGIKKVANRFKTDLGKPTVFWITNPKVLMVNNVAAGSMGIGMWYTFPTAPLKPSDGLVYQRKEASQTQLWRNDNNVVHSNMRSNTIGGQGQLRMSTCHNGRYRKCQTGGFVFDNILQDNGRVVGCMRYAAYKDPLDPKSGPIKSQITRLTAYKNTKLNLWLRGGWLELMQLSSAESAKGIQIARGSKQQMFVKKSIFLGHTSNSETEVGYPDAVTGADLKQYIGVVFHDGPTYIETSWFNGFLSDQENGYVAAAIGFVPKHKFSTSVVANTTGLRFGFTDGVDGIRVYNGKLDESVLGLGDTFNADEKATFRDGDGTVSKCPGDDTFAGPVQLVVPTKYSLTDRCAYREPWDMVVCRDVYGKLGVGFRSVFKGSNDDFDRSGQMRRISYSGESDVAYETLPNRKVTQYLTILGSNEYYYEYQYMKDFPREIRFTGLGVEKNAHVVLGICLPEETTPEDYDAFFKVGSNKAFGNKALTYVDSLQAVVDDTTMKALYLNGRMLYVKIWSNYTRDPDWSAQDSDHCPGSFCPRFQLKMKTYKAYTPCFTASKDDLSTAGVLDGVPRHNCTLLPSDPEADWGVGDTMASHDGNWGEWTAWTDCNSCQDESVNPVSRSRYRLCDNPPKYGEGADCSGEGTEIEDCPPC